MMKRVPCAILALTSLAGCAARPVAARFPDDWLGSWEGEVTPHAADGVKPGFRMRLDIEATDDPARVGWTITYTGDAGTQVRAYELVTRDAASGRYAIDERNGIVLEQRLVGGAFYSWFDIGGTRLAVREMLVPGGGATGDVIEVEIATSRDRDAVATGPSGEATSHPVVSVQRASLRRTARAR